MNAGDATVDVDSRITLSKSKRVISVFRESYRLYASLYGFAVNEG